MPKEYLTAEEIYAIDKLDDATMWDYISALPDERRNLAIHVFGKFNYSKFSNILLKESNEGIDFLIKKMKDKGISAV